jgi:hypothetical protein
MQVNTVNMAELGSAPLSLAWRPGVQFLVYFNEWIPMSQNVTD